MDEAARGAYLADLWPKFLALAPLQRVWFLAVLAYRLTVIARVQHLEHDSATAIAALRAFNELQHRLTLMEQEQLAPLLTAAQPYRYATTPPTVWHWLFEQTERYGAGIYLLQVIEELLTHLAGTVKE